MKNKIIKYFIVALSIGILSSCDDLWDLNLEPGKPVYDGEGNEGIIRGQLTAAYSFLLYQEVMGEFYYGPIGGVDTDEMYRNNVSSATNILNAHNISTSSNELLNFWKTTFKINEAAANVIMMCKTVEGMREEEKNDLCGQAMVLQAFSHFLLTANFGPIPIKDVPTYEMGLNSELERKPVKEVCEYALSLCRQAIPMLKPIDKVGHSGLITKSAAEALSLRIALYMASHPDIKDTQKYNDIVEWGDKFIAEGPNKLNTQPITVNEERLPAYARLFVKNMQSDASWNNTTDPEGIWSIMFFVKSINSGEYQGGRYKVNNRLGSQLGVPCPDRTANSAIGYADLTYRALNNLYDKYTDFNHGAQYPIGDLRRDWNIPTFCYKYTSTDAAIASHYTLKSRFDYFNVIMPAGITCTKEATLLPVFDKNTWADNSGNLAGIYIEDGGSGYKDANNNSDFEITIPRMTANPTTMAGFNYTNGGIVGYKIGANLNTGGIHRGYQNIQAYNNTDGVRIIVTSGVITKIEKLSSNTANIGTRFAMVTERGIGKWRREYETDLPPIREQWVTACHLPYLRFADVLLMVSEAHLFASNGNKAKGLEYLNQVRRRAYGVDINNPNSKVDFPTYNLETIMDERSRELCFEGVRRTDLVRWNAYLEPYDAVSKVVSGNPNHTNINSPISKLGANYQKYHIFPIPETELGLSPNTFYQNTGW